MQHALQCHQRPFRQITQGGDVSRDSRWSHNRSAPAPVILAHKAEQSEKREAPAKQNNAFTALGTRRTDRPQIMDLMGNPAVKANIFTELSRDGLFVLCRAHGYFMTELGQPLLMILFTRPQRGPVSP